MIRYLITGGCGFVGAAACRAIQAADPSASVTAFDNLRRRGSELNARSLAGAGTTVMHGDIRIASDLEDLDGFFDVIIDAAAEPSVHAGLQESPRYVIDTNLVGTVNLLEFARRRAGTFVLLSTSRVYSIGALRSMRVREASTRFELDEAQELPGASSRGISEDFPTDGPRSYYGASKLASEMIAGEYAASTSLDVVINRCGVLAGPGQFGRADQGVVGLWVAAHVYGRPLRYTGFGGSGKQVRDVLHIDDLMALLLAQLPAAGRLSGLTFNVGGGPACSTSLRELTRACEERTGRSINIAAVPETASVDVPLYISDTSRVLQEVGWAPSKTVRDIVNDVASWIESDLDALRPILT